MSFSETFAPLPKGKHSLLTRTKAEDVNQAYGARETFVGEHGNAGDNPMKTQCPWPEDAFHPHQDAGKG